MPNETPQQTFDRANQTIASLGGTPVISADTLSNPNQAFKIPDIPTETPAPFQPSFATQQMGQTVQGNLSDIKSTVDQLGQAEVRRQQLENDQGIPQINERLSELNALDAQYAADLSNITSQELQQNVRGDLATNYAPLRDAISSRNTRINIQRQQDINIKRSTNAAAIAAANGQLSLAQNYVQRALDYEFKPLETELEFKKLVYQENKESFTKAEQREFEARLKAEERKYEKDKEKREAILDLTAVAAQNGADPRTLARIQEAKDIGDAFAAAGEFASTPDNQIVQLENGSTVVVDRRSGKVISNLGGAKPNVSIPEYAPSEGNPIGLSPLAQQVYNQPRAYHDLTPSAKESVITELGSKVPGWSVPKKLGAEQEKAVSLAEAGLLALQDLEGQIYNEDGSINRSALGWASTPIIGAFTRTGAAQRALIDPISRLRTGAAMTPSEEKFYGQLMPRSVDSPELIEQKTAQLKAFYSGIAGSPVTLISPDGQAFRYNDMFDQNQRLEVRKALDKGYKFVDY